MAITLTNKTLKEVQDSIQNLQNQIDFINQNMASILQVSDKLDDLLELLELAIRKDGTVKMEADFNLNMNKLRNVGAPQVDTDAVRLMELLNYLKRDGTTPLTGDWDVGGKAINNTANLAENDLSNVDDATILNKLKNVDGDGSGLDADLVRGVAGNLLAKTDLSNVENNTVLDKVKKVDGDGSGLDADLVRGYDMLTRNYVSPIDLSSATSDYNLAVGEVAKIDFVSATSQPLHIATQDGTYYEMKLLPSNTGGTTGATLGDIYLLPNNTTYSSAFVDVIFYVNNAGSNSSNSANIDAFRLGWCYTFAIIYILNRTVYKSTISIENRYGHSTTYPSYEITITDWHDTTTIWTSLGTITFPQSTSGTILVRRLM